MLSPSFISLLAAKNRLLEELPRLFNDQVPLELILPVLLAIVAMVLGVLYGKSIRMEDHGWRVGLIAATFLASLSVILFWEYKLGVDLQGGAILVYEIDEKATAENHPEGKVDINMSELMQVLTRRLNPTGSKEIIIRPFGPKQIEIVIPEVDKDEIDAVKRDIVTAGVLRFMILADSETKDRGVRDAALNQAEEENTKEKMDRSVKDPTDPKKIIGFWASVRQKPAGKDTLEFVEPSLLSGALLRNGDTGDIINLPIAVQQQMNQNPTLYSAYFQQQKMKDVQVLMAVDPEIDLRGNDLATATEGMGNDGSPCINFTMKGASIWKMAETTGNNRPTGNTHRRLGILWDNVLESAPRINSTISERGEITGSFTPKEVREKVELLRSGSMPVVMHHEPISEDRIGATLGAETVKKGSQAIVISLAIVLGFVMIYYRGAGIIACFALALNVMLTVAIMFALKAPFTLPGLAGLVLTVGMSVDANVLIYERIREELEKGAALRMAIRNGFDKALVTIIDSNVTTLLTALILYIIGTDQVRGFGMTLILGILTSMYTAIFCSRAILEIGEKAYRWQTLSMFKFLTQPHIDWMKLFRPASIASIILVVIGLVATVLRGQGIFDIDMAGGTSVQFVLDPKHYAEVTEADVRKRLADAFDGVEVTETKARADHNVYRKFLEQNSEGTGQQMVWKVDSSLLKVEELQDVVRKAFRTADGAEGLQTYDVSLGEITEVQPTAPPELPNVVPPSIGSPGVGPVEAPPKTDAPKTDTPKTDAPDAPKSDTPKADAPKGDEPKTDAPKAETPKSDSPKSDTPAKEESKTEDSKKEENKDSSDCQPADDPKKSDEPKTEPKTEPKSESKDEDKKADEPQADPAKSEPEKADPAKTTPPVAPETPPADPTKPASPVDPGKLIPEASPFAPAVKAPANNSSTIRSTTELKLSNSPIGGLALQKQLEDAAEAVLNKRIEANVSTPGWKGDNNKSFSNWTVSLPLPKAEAEQVLQQVTKTLESEPVWQTSSEIGGQVSEATRWRALGAVVGSIFVMIVYMWIRFHKISWGIAAAIALAHDALVMLGAIAVSYWLAVPLGFLQVEEFKISLPVVAAFLTLIGYSINDTIVIFDRLREIRGKSPEITGAMINEAVNQTLSRTILTAGTTLVVIVILYFLGGSGIHAFAFSLIVGVISGSYSTVFIASPILLYLIGLDQEKTKKKIPAATASSTTRGAA